MGNILWMAIALVAGGLLPFLGAFNARLGVAIASPLYASVVSFVVGTMVLSTFVFATRQSVTWPGAGKRALVCLARRFLRRILTHRHHIDVPETRSGIRVRTADCGAVGRRSHTRALQRTRGGSSPHKLLEDYGSRTGDCWCSNDQDFLVGGHQATRG